MKQVVELPLTDITVSGQFQGRRSTNDEVIEQYREALVRGDCFPPVEVYEVDAQLILVDGFHRYASHRKAGRESIMANVTRGSEARALETALCANQIHGLPRSNADKRLIVERALRAALNSAVCLVLCMSISPFQFHIVDVY